MTQNSWLALYSALQCTGNASTLYYTASPLLPAAETGEISRVIILVQDFSWQCLVSMHVTPLGVRPLPSQLLQAVDENLLEKPSNHCYSQAQNWHRKSVKVPANSTDTASWMCVVFLTVLEHFVYIICLLLLLPSRKTNQQFIVKRGWRQSLLVQEHQLLPGDIRHRSEPLIQTQLLDMSMYTNFMSNICQCTHSLNSSVSIFEPYFLHL